MKHYRKNPRQITKKQMSDLKKWLVEFGDLSGIVHNIPTDEIIGGNQRSEALPGIISGLIQPIITERFDPPLEDGTVCNGYYNIEGRRYQYRGVSWDDKKAERANLIANKAGGTFDMDILANQFDLPVLLDSGFEERELIGFDFGEPKDAEPQTDRAAELLEKWQVKTGDLWQIGEHRLICGDSTEMITVSRLLSGVNVALVHADPPYGMGKENEGIANDNLYREKLDAFQMAWFQTCRPFIQDNSSVYIWGTADDLWRFWYGMLSKYERLTFRNEIVWQKHGAQGIGSDAHRMYPTASERCLFFMLGEQGFNVNASNYWEGWTPIVDYLENQRQLAGWSIKDTKRIAGHSENSGCHWFDKSQWSMPTREVYEAWQHKAESSDAFKREYDELKREYDELKREFYSTRAYFDNAHENMTDVWDFGRVTGDERMGHATPKPVAMMERVIKSSAPIGAGVLVPFAGTSPEMVACENTGRICYGADLEPAYIALSLERMSTAFPELEIKRIENDPQT